MHPVLKLAAHALGLAVALAGATASAQQPATPTAAASAPLEEVNNSNMGARLMYELLVSELSFRDGDPRAAYSVMLSAARRTGNADLYKRATEMAIQSRSGPAALEVARAWRQAQPQSVDANRYELQVLVALNQIAETEAPLRATLAAAPAADKPALLAAIPALYARASDKTLAAQIVTRALEAETRNRATAAAAWTSIGRMRLQAGDTPGALAAAADGQAAEPSSEWPALLALQVFSDSGDAKAENLLRTHIKSPQSKPQVRLGYARALVDAGRPAEARAQLTELTRAHPNYADGWLIFGLMQAQDRHDAEAETMLQRYLSVSAAAAKPDAEGGVESNASADQAYLALAQIAERRKDYAAAEAMLARVESADNALNVHARRAGMLAQQGRMAEARAAIRAAPERRPEDERIKLLAEAQLLRDNAQPREAYDLLRFSLQKAPEDEELLYDTALTAQKLGQFDEMERMLRQIIERNPKAQHALNALGYSLAERNLRLPEARELIQKAANLAPDDAYIQDSLGWVEFRMGRGAEAARILEAAFRRRPDAEIAAHLGEVLWSRGQRERALEIWRQGQRLNPANQTLQDTLKRLRVRL